MQAIYYDYVHMHIHLESSPRLRCACCQGNTVVISLVKCWRLQALLCTYMVEHKCHHNINDTSDHQHEIFLIF